MTEVYIGHTPVTRIGLTEPAQRACVRNVDPEPPSNPLTIMDVDTKESWQSEPLHQLYFDKRQKLAKN
jgi:serine/threonine protein phosphatase 1